MATYNSVQCCHAKQTYMGLGRYRVCMKNGVEGYKHCLEEDCPFIKMRDYDEDDPIIDNAEECLHQAKEFHETLQETLKQAELF